MPSSDADIFYELLLKRYKEQGILTPKVALDTDIEYLVKKGRTREEAIRELKSSDSPWTYSPAERPRVSQQTNEQDIEVLRQIANLREKIDSLTTLFSRNEITEETYRRGVQKIEEDISRLQQEHKIPTTEEHEPSPASIRRTTGYETTEETNYSHYRSHYRSPDRTWYLVPLLFGLLGGILAYVAVKDDDQEMADNLLIFGILWTIAFAFIVWFLFLRMFG